MIGPCAAAARRGELLAFAGLAGNLVAGRDAVTAAARRRQVRRVCGRHFAKASAHSPSYKPPGSGRKREPPCDGVFGYLLLKCFARPGCRERIEKGCKIETVKDFLVELLLLLLLKPLQKALGAV